MTVTLTKPTLESTIQQLVRLYWSNQGRDLPASKMNVAESYWQRGLREGIAAILFQHRGDSLPRFKTIPMIYESDVNAILRKHETDFVDGSGSDKPIVLDAIYAELIEFAVPQELIETDEAERRRLVLSGEEKALPDDRKWIDALVEEKRAEADRLIAILQGTPVRHSKVNDAPAGWRAPTVYDGECDACASSGVGACDDAPHPKRPGFFVSTDQPSEAARSHVDD